MKRQKNRKRQSRKPAAGAAARVAAPSTAPERPGRRDFLRRARNGALVGAGVLGAGWYLVEDVNAHRREHDLARIGNGIPAVVQIHDPECPRCRALQRETRRALEDFEPGEIQYLVANIRTDEGRALAAKHGVGHVTLLLMDGAGKRNHTLRGANTSESLKQAFRLHINALNRGALTN